MPLEKTVVTGSISGLGAEVTVRQTFTNPSIVPIEALYTFPLAEDAAVNRMHITVGDRLIEGEIKRKEEARQLYNRAKAAGMTAALFDQERPNIFTQSVANIMPGKSVTVEISYVDTIDWKEGEFEFSFPMTVGPRFIPAGSPGARRIAPPRLRPGVKSGQKIELNVTIDAGGPIKSVHSVLHAISVEQNPDGASVSLSRADERVNRDFILRWRTPGEEINTSFIQHSNRGGAGTFCLILAPPAAPPVEIIRDREIIFVMDQSGSQSGFPIDKSKELTEALMKALRPGDTFNLISFANKAVSLWPESRPFTQANAQEALAKVRSLKANGGTMISPAVDLALRNPPRDGRLRLVVFNTDGFVGNEAEILKKIRQMRGESRMFTFGIGNGVNRFLIEAMSAEGRGDAEIVTLAEAADLAAERFIRRIESPLLTDVSVRVEGGGVFGVSPETVPDVFSAEPTVIFGRWTRPGPAKITITGELAGKPWEKIIDVNFHAFGSKAPALQTLWARRRIADLERVGWLESRQSGGGDKSEAALTKQRVIDIALKNSLVTEYTSFIAVEKRRVNIRGRLRTVHMPIEMTEGVDMEARGGEGYVPSGIESVTYSATDNTFIVQGTTRAKSGGGGFGGGGFGGSRGGASSGASGAGRGGLARRSSSSARKAVRSAPVEEFSVSRGRQAPPSKLSPDLKGLTGVIEVQVQIKSFDAFFIEALQKAGLEMDAEDQSLKSVFGTITAKNLAELIKLDDVVYVFLLEDD
jgi:Ca-activated chloride channel family protein